MTELAQVTDLVHETTIQLLFTIGDTIPTTTLMPLMIQLMIPMIAMKLMTVTNFLIQLMN
jgi:hypothetical protein